ncbi:Starch-binding associating with outer membrane [Reichenbachiella faecimaris]|uniref:Starch-binding associating with outer membrane n=1 Tax=Reichenbachiella faecimaris TaxID=692418 RepID=A0A1W2G861_REIFA|nr:RagB/SusD family nutrient uptake outer membrane protein [Reichenbachiella faecimaris]SMD32823.1 Starch-binding associating with outer membrane [Reichenbachiella faecimaris]
MKKILIVIIAVVLVSSCQDALEIPPQSNLELGNFFASVADFELALGGAYDVVASHQGPSNGFGSYFRGLMMMGRAGTDEMFVAQYDDHKYIGNYTYTPFSRVPADTYADQYRGISRCNVIIGKINENVVSMSTDSRNKILGEASFLRGFYYFQLARFFGGVPIITESTNINEFKNVRSTLAETYERVIADFKTAEENLPVTNEDGRATKYVAKTYLAKVYLQMSGVPLNDASAAALAASYAKDVIDNGPYDLEPVYGDIFELDNEHGIEYIFDAEYISSNNEGGQVGTWDGTLGPWENNISYKLGRATVELFDSYDPLDLRRARNVVDYLVINANGDTEPITDGTVYAYKWRHDPDPATRGYSTEWQSPFNFPLTRYADVLLTYAEAKWRDAGSSASYSDAEALLAINQVRRRGFGLDINSPQSVDLGSINEQALLDERKWELAFEGHRWVDLVRFGKLLETVQALTSEGSQFAAANIQEYHILYPIPAREIQISGGDLKQNPGYSTE